MHQNEDELVYDDYNVYVSSDKDKGGTNTANSSIDNTQVSLYS